MANFNRGNKGYRGGGFGRRDFKNRDSRGPVTMHRAICDNCGKECEVPFRPTSGKPIFCSNCFENKRGSDSPRFEGRNSERSSFENRPMFDAVCNECGNNCQVPFRPSGDKPVYCSNCFGDKKKNGERDTEQISSQYREQFETLNTKLDKILDILMPIASEVKKEEETAQEEVEVTKKTKAPKKNSAKK